MAPPDTDHALDVWSIVVPEVQVAVLIALVLIAGGWLWHRVVIKRLDVMPERRSSGVPPEVLAGILEEMSRNQSATTVALEHLARAVESLRELVHDSRCSYKEGVGKNG